MIASEYQKQAMRTNDHKSSYRLIKFTNPPEQRFDMCQLFNATLGLSGEVGEFNDALKKMIFHERSFDENHLREELGDILWYIALISDTFGWDLGLIMHDNICKLEQRHPEGFHTDY